MTTPLSTKTHYTALENPFKLTRGAVVEVELRTRSSDRSRGHFVDDGAEVEAGGVDRASLPHLRGHRHGIVVQAQGRRVDPFRVLREEGGGGRHFGRVVEWFSFFGFGDGEIFRFCCCCC